MRRPFSVSAYTPGRHTLPSRSMNLIRSQYRWSCQGHGHANLEMSAGPLLQPATESSCSRGTGLRSRCGQCAQVTRIFGSLKLACPVGCARCCFLRCRALLQPQATPAQSLDILGRPAQSAANAYRSDWAGFFASPRPRGLFTNVGVVTQFFGSQDWPCDQLQGLELGFKCSAAGGGAVFGGCSHFAPLSSLDWLGGADFQSPDICRQIPDKNPDIRDSVGQAQGRVRHTLASGCAGAACFSLPCAAPMRGQVQRTIRHARQWRLRP